MGIDFQQFVDQFHLTKGEAVTLTVSVFAVLEPVLVQASDDDDQIGIPGFKYRVVA